MKRLIPFVLALALAPLATFSQNLEIPDPCFLRALIEAGVDSNEDGKINQTEAEAVTILDVSEDTISDITGIEHFIHLQHLDCSQNFLIDSLDVSALTELVSLQCYLNSLRNLDVSDNAQLRLLNCGANVISTLNISNNPLLDTLDCQGNMLSELDLSYNPSLVWLNCGGNLFTTLDVSGNANLKSFLCMGGLLNSLDVSQNTALELLNCEDNRLTALDVSNNPALRSLGCAENDLTGLNLANNLALEHLNCSKNPLNDLDISNNVALLGLRCDGIQLSDLDLSNNPVLESLFCSYTGLSRLDLSQNPALEMLWCEGNLISHLDLSNNLMIRYLLVPFMPRLYEVCVWDQFTDSVEIHMDESPNVYFTTDCIYNNDSIVFIPDTNFLNALIALGVDTGGDGLISYSEAESVTKLDLSAMNPEQAIGNMTGIEAFVHLDSLGCDNNSFTELDVSALTDLEYLSCSGTYSEMDGCSGRLQSLDLSENSILLALNCSCNPLTHLDLSDNTSLTDLKLTQMPSVSDVRVWTLPFPPGGITIDTTGSPNLHFTLDSAENHIKIPDINFLDALVGQGVDTDGNGMISITEAEAVTTLEVSGKNITELTGISHFINLKKLDCRGNELANLDLSALSHLATLFCSGNDLSQLDLSPNSELTRLDCGSNPMKILDVSENLLLDSLEIVSDYAMKTLDLSNNPELTFLTCAYIGLSSLDVSHNTELTSLSIAASAIRSLDVSHNTKLKKLECSLNLLSELDVSNNSEMSSLYCRGNFISNLNLSANPLLRTVYCGDNRLMELDVSGLSLLRQLYFEYNQLSTLDLRFNPDLVELDGSSNIFHNLDISQNQEITLLNLRDIPSLTEVCVWESFASSGCRTYTDGSPNICFETDCNGACDQSDIETINQNGFSIYPNPVNDLLTIDMVHSGPYHIEIVALSGQRIFDRELYGSSCQVDFSVYPKGIYLIVIMSDDAVRTGKIIKL